jgi:hypothetical protein
VAAPSFFRGLILAALAFLAADLLIDFIEPTVPDEVAAYLDEQNAGSLSGLLDDGNIGAKLGVSILLLGYLVAYIGSLLGMLAFKRWARVAFLFVVPLGLVIDISYATAISTPWQTVITAMVAMTHGAILTLLFVEPVRARFRAQSPAAAPPPETPPSQSQPLP